MRLENDNTRIVHMGHLVETLWKCKYFIICGTVLFLAISIVFGCVELKQKAEIEKNKPDYKEETIEVSMDQFYNIRTVVEVEELLTEKVEYNEKSILQNIDPQHKWLSIDLYTVVVPDESGESSISIAHRYAEYLCQTENYQNMIKMLNLQAEEGYVREVVYFESNDQSQFSVNIFYSDGETIEKIKGYVQKQIEEFYQKDIALGKNYTFEVKASGIQESIDKELMSTQNAIRATIIDAQDSLNYRLSLLTEEEKEYLELYREHCNDKDYVEGQALVKVSKTKKKDYSISVQNLKPYAKKGMVSGFFLTTILISLLYIFSNRLLNPQNLKEMYDLCILSIITKEKKRILDLKSMAVKLFLINHKKEKNNIRIGIVSSCMDRIDEKDINQIVEFVEKQGFCVKVVGSVLDCPDNIKQISEVDSLVLLEKMVYSKLADIQKETEFLQDIKKEIDGVIILG